MGGLIGGGGAKGMLAPLSNHWEGLAPWPPSSYAYEDMLDKTYSWHRLCYAKPISGKGYAEQNLIKAYNIKGFSCKNL